VQRVDVRRLLGEELPVEVLGFLQTPLLVVLQGQFEGLPNRGL
jgi:hypothetical protein